MVSLPRSWQDLGKANKELTMDLGKDNMASNTGFMVMFNTSRSGLDPLGILTRVRLELRYEGMSTFKCSDLRSLVLSVSSRILHQV